MLINYEHSYVRKKHFTCVLIETDIVLRELQQVPCHFNTIIINMTWRIPPSLLRGLILSSYGNTEFHLRERFELFMIYFHSYHRGQFTKNLTNSLI